MRIATAPRLIGIDDDKKPIEVTRRFDDSWLVTLRIRAFEAKITMSRDELIDLAQQVIEQGAGDEPGR